MRLINLDTHILVHALQDRIRSGERTLLRENRWGISAIVLWELAKLSQLGRVSLDFSDPAVEVALSSIHVWPIDIEVSLASTQLDFRGDPADELIAATSIVHRVPLLTRDKQIRQSKLVSFT